MREIFVCPTCGDITPLDPMAPEGMSYCGTCNAFYDANGAAHPAYPNQWDDWVASRPPVIQAMIREFPPQLPVYTPDGRQWWILSWNEDDTMQVTPICPHGSSEAYDRGLEARVLMCADHFRTPR